MKKYFLLFFRCFKSFEPYEKNFNRDDFDYEKLSNSDVIFMRWKERFTLPDHRVRYKV